MVNSGQKINTTTSHKREKWRNPNRKDNADCKRKRYGQKTIRERNSCVEGFMRIIKWSFIHCIIVINRWQTAPLSPWQPHHLHCKTKTKSFLFNDIAPFISSVQSWSTAHMIKTGNINSWWSVTWAPILSAITSQFLTSEWNFMHSPSKCTLVTRSQQNPLICQQKVNPNKQKNIPILHMLATMAPIMLQRLCAFCSLLDDPMQYQLSVRSRHLLPSKYMQRQP